MPLAALREEVCRANLALFNSGLVMFTWGNVSGIDRDSAVMAIKPSGVAYESLTPDDIVLVYVETGNPVDGRLRPSSDTPTHLALYRAFPEIGGVAHTHSLRATAFAQALRPIPCLGTTHADTFFGAVPVTRPLTDDEIAGAYEANTGPVMVERFIETGVDPQQVPACLVAHHGPFTWGGTAAEAVENAVILETTAGMALDTLALSPGQPGIPDALLQRHFRRKHGPSASYGQG